MTPKCLTNVCDHLKCFASSLADVADPQLTNYFHPRRRLHETVQTATGGEWILHSFQRCRGRASNGGD